MSTPYFFNKKHYETEICQNDGYEAELWKI